MKQGQNPARLTLAFIVTFGSGLIAGVLYTVEVFKAAHNL